MRLRMIDYAIGFWFVKTSHGFSMGPVIPGEEHVHLTFFMKDNLVNAHLKIIENGVTQYRNLITMPYYQFRRKLLGNALEILSSLEPLNPNEEVILVTNSGYRLFRKLVGGSLTLTHKGRKCYIDFDFSLIADEIQSVTEEPLKYFKIGKATELLYSPTLKFGFTEKGAPIFLINNKPYSWQTNMYQMNHGLEYSRKTDGSFDFLRQTTWGKPIYDIMGTIGIPQLLSEVEKRKLIEKWITKNLNLKPYNSNQKAKRKHEY